MTNKCPKCHKDGYIEDREHDDDKFTAKWFMLCHDCQWQWEIVAITPVIQSQERVPGC